VERKVRLCGYTIAFLMDYVMSLDASLETIHDSYVAGKWWAIADYVRVLEQRIDDMKFALKLAEKACDTRPGAERVFDKFISSLKSGVKEIGVDPRKADEYRIYKYHLSESVKALLSAD
jgi:hypothetical protein